MREDKEYVWWGFEIENRITFGTYDKFDLEKLPTPTILSTFENIDAPEKIPDGLKITIEKFSPTACYFSSEDNGSTGDGSFHSEAFFRDQQDCFVCHFNYHTGEVYYDKYKNRVCGRSLPEFFSRVVIESLSWYRLNRPKEITSLFGSFPMEELKKAVEKYVGELAGASEES